MVLGLKSVITRTFGLSFSPFTPSLNHSLLVITIRRIDKTARQILVNLSTSTFERD
ncbi:hypothetical protein VCRA2128O102_80118 [Vibrio crassostreae]|nr:hypothetical protein VCRA2128O106_80076 [Vibrio crassostreae]CAK3116114.1 hypothetical protein VCRA2126O84_80118 [Vibrio crassostreae]CAK3604977.1 hypothetical protein VCRA2128O102_80118 [Vibrio crassostreae]CAK3606736.1 hypothetical protein VCRA2128O101_80118 [Vibrio crassostreae]CAK3687843.1 hypothetical protein VCRA2128O107_70118 [Vibrio crassostreae]